MKKTKQMEDKKPLSELLVKSPIQQEDLDRDSHRQVWEALRGPKGKDGKDGAPGRDGKNGRDGRNGFDGLDGEDGKDGKDGKDGARGSKGERGEQGFPGEMGAPGKNGKDGKDGKDGSPDKPEDIIAKIHHSKVKIKATAIEGFANVANDIATTKKQMQSYAQMGGPTQLRVKQNGTPLGAIETINFTNATITPVGDGREINVTLSGTGGLNPQIPSGTINGKNTTFTCSGLVNVAFADGTVDPNASITGSTNSTVVYSVPPQNNVYAF